MDDQQQNQNQNQQQNQNNNNQNQNQQQNENNNNQNQNQQNQNNQTNQYYCTASEPGHWKAAWDCSGWDSGGCAVLAATSPCAPQHCRRRPAHAPWLGPGSGSHRSC